MTKLQQLADIFEIPVIALFDERLVDQHTKEIALLEKRLLEQEENIISLKIKIITFYDYYRKGRQIR